MLRSSKGHFIPGSSTQPPTPPSDNGPGFNAHVNRTKVTDHRKSVTSSVTRSPDIFPFMELPPELRNCIYEFIIEDISTTEDDPIHLAPMPSSCRHIYFPPEDDRVLHGGISWKWWWMFEQSRNKILYCRLDRVSHTIRREFVPMLWSRMHVRYCLCIHMMGDDEQAISLDLLRGRVAYIMWNMDEVCRSFVPWLPGLQRTRMEFVEFLKKVDFKGTIKLVGRRAQVEGFREALEGIAAAENTEHAQQMAMQKVKQIDEAYDAILRKHFDNPGTDDVHVKFDINLRESRYDDDTI